MFKTKHKRKRKKKKWRWWSRRRRQRRRQQWQRHKKISSIWNEIIFAHQQVYLIFFDSIHVASTGAWSGNTEIYLKCNSTQSIWAEVNETVCTATLIDIFLHNKWFVIIVVGVFVCVCTCCVYVQVSALNNVNIQPKNQRNVLR